MNNPFSLTGKTVLVTGASSGIGRGIAVACAQMGARVVLSGRNKDRLYETLYLMEEGMNNGNRENHIVIPADLTISMERRALVAEIPDIDGLVQCAGVGSRIPCKMIGEEDLREIIQPNTEAPILLQSELLQAKKIRPSASIVYIASAAATMPSVCNAVYSASKAAIIAYAKCLAQELAPRQIRVNCISPTMVWTELALVGATEEQLHKAELNYPLKRYGQPKDIAYLAVYMLSDTATWMTGSNVEITGGALSL